MRRGSVFNFIAALLAVVTLLAAPHVLAAGEVLSLTAVLISSCTPGALLRFSGTGVFPESSGYTVTASTLNFNRGTSTSLGPLIPNLPFPYSGNLIAQYNAVPAQTQAHDILSTTFRIYHLGVLVASSTMTFDCTTGQLVSLPGPAAAPPLPPDTFLSDVCEPFDGFSADGWMTWDTNAQQRGAAPDLYAAPIADGPWQLLNVSTPPWPLSRDMLNAFAAQVGAPSYPEMWFKTAENGAPVHIGSAIRDRAARMDQLCGID